jgi:hypothetical protein
MSITPKAIQDLLDELEASKQSRLRAWNVLQRLRLVLSEAGKVTIPQPAQKTFDAEGEAVMDFFTRSSRWAGRWLWGVAGMLLAVPILAIVKIFCDRVDSLTQLGEFLGD